MFNTAEIKELRERIFNLVEFEYKDVISVEEFDGVKVKAENGKVTVGGSSLSQIARAFFLFAMENSLGKSKIDIEQKPRFEQLGTMLAVQYTMKPEAVVKYMEAMSALGYNYMLLYMETSYEIKGYPYFGYMRGRYSKEDLMYIDAQGAKLGIEVIPCIQTFGHMQDYLRWQANTDVKDSAECLLADNEKTYELIEAMVSTVSDAFKSRRIHIGFDETRGMGLGRYLIDHKYTDRNEIFCRHLVRVKEICFKYGYKPMMWSDMPFRLGGDGYAEEYDENCVIPPIVFEATADVDMCYWDYYIYHYELYDHNIIRHFALFNQSKVIFSGAVWARDYHVINMEQTMKTMLPALEACLDNGMKDVNATIWGNASFTNLEQSLIGLPVFSEYCYIGKGCTEDDIYKVSAYLTKVPRKYTEAISEFHLEFPQSFSMGARLMWCDVLFELMHHNLDYAWARDRLSKALRVIEAEEKDHAICPKEYAEKLFKIAIIKCDILGGLRGAYQTGDKAFMDMVANEYIDTLIPLYERVCEIKETLWLNSTRPFGVEKITTVFASVIARHKFAKKRINDYLSGSIDRIEELEQEILDEGYVGWFGAESHYMS